MKKLTVVLALLIFVTNAVNAMEINLPSETVSVMAGSSVKLPLIITNNGEVEKIISISVFPPQSQGVMTLVYPQIVSLLPGKSKNVTVYFSALKKAKPIPTTFTLSVKDLSTGNTIYSKSITVIVYRNNPLYLDSINLDKYSFYPNETVNISVTVANSVDQLSSPSVLDVKITYNSKVLKDFKEAIDPLGPGKTKTILLSYHLGPYAPNGTYTIQATLNDVGGNYIDSLQTQFNVKAVYMIPEECTKKVTTWSLLSTHTKIIVKNTGNVPAPAFYITETVPSFLKDFFKPSTKPTKVETKGNQVIYKWLISGLKPGESVIIEYSINLWFAWIELLLIGGVIYFVFMISFKPTVRKKHGEIEKISPEKEIPIIIEIKNKSRKIMKNITVQDSLPIMAKVVPRFETIKPQVRKLKKRVELIWRFNRLNPGEERVLIYYIKPIVSISGNFTLPPVKVIYYDEKNEKRMILSNELTIA